MPAVTFASYLALMYFAVDIGYYLSFLNTLQTRQLHTALAYLNILISRGFNRNCILIITNKSLYHYHNQISYLQFFTKQLVHRIIRYSNYDPPNRT